MGAYRRVILGGGHQGVIQTNAVSEALRVGDQLTRVMDTD